MRFMLLTATLAASMALTGCAALTGFSNAQSDFSCGGKAGEPSCRSITEVFNSPVKGQASVSDGYKEIEEGSFFSRKKADPIGEIAAAATASRGPMHEASLIATPDAPWRTPEKVMRVWMAPFTDEMGDLHDQRYLFVRVKDASWRADAVANLAKQRPADRPVYPLKDPNAAEPAPQKKNSVDPAKLLPLLGKGVQ